MIKKVNPFLKNELKKRRCAICKETYTPRRINLQVTKVCLAPECVLAWGKKLKNDQIKKAKILEDKKRLDQKKEYFNKNIPKQLELCTPVFNKMRVLQELKWFKDRGLEPACISCGKGKGGDVWCCGHFKTVGARGNLRFDVKNTYLQHNKSCNKELSGNINGNKNSYGYIEGLKIRFGKEEGEAIINYCESNTATVKWNAEELIAWRKEWARQVRELKKELGM